MPTKLTLSINEKTVEKAKRISANVVKALARW